MGVILSYIGKPGQSNEPDPATGLTPREKFLVKNSWDLVKQDLTGFGVQIFIVYVTKFPQYKKLFSFRDVPNEKLPNDKKIKGHATNVMYALAAVLDNLNNNDVLMEVLEKTGESHGKKNIQGEAYWEEVKLLYHMPEVRELYCDDDLLIFLYALHEIFVANASIFFSTASVKELKGCIMEVLQAGLGSKFTPETRQAWDKTITVAFTVIVKTLILHQPK